MTLATEPLSGPELDAWRERYRRETKGQIVHDSLHRRPGWTVSLLLRANGAAVGYASTAVAGPWSGMPTLFELYLQPELRPQAAEILAAFLAASGVRHFEAQTNDGILTDLVRAFGRGTVTDKIVFEDMLTTSLPAGEARFVCHSTETDIRDAIARRQGGGEWCLELAGTAIATGGVLFHYNPPYGDVYMEVIEAYRRQGWGALMVQELKRATYQLGQIPCARCNATNLASRRTLQRAGFAPCGEILVGLLDGPYD